MQYVSRNRPRQGKKMNDVELSRSELDHLIEQWIFSQRDRAVIRRRMFDGVTFEQLSDEFGLSVRQTKNIVYKSKEKIYKHIPSR